LFLCASDPIGRLNELKNAREIGCAIYLEFGTPLDLDDDKLLCLLLVVGKHVAHGERIDF
jgi:hypothetical protein